MNFARVFSAQAALLGARIVTAEVDLSKGLHSFAIVGLPDKAVEEARDRISAAIKNAGFVSPKQKNQKVVISLAPADLKKEGPAFDVAMALGYLLSAGEINFNPEKKIFLGELSLKGDVREIRGVLSLVKEAKKAGFQEAFVPIGNAREAALIEGVDIYGIETLYDTIGHLTEKKIKNASITLKKIEKTPKTKIRRAETSYDIDFADIKGQRSAKRGLEIAAAGGHNIALFGPPGTGKTMLAKAFRHILPPLSFDEILDVTAIHSIAGLSEGKIITDPPIRAPHHTSSYVAITGGGAALKPGEITLAHRGVLFLDEFAEFDRRVLEALRQPLEERTISVSRAKGSAVFPADFILVAAMNPCPCGNFGNSSKICICTPSTIMRYQRKISGPIMDRIDIWVEVSEIDHRKLSEKGQDGERTSEIRKRVIQARERQAKHWKSFKRKIKTNSQMTSRDIANNLSLKEDVQNLLASSGERLDLSGRAYHKVIKLAQTIADLDGDKDIETKHVLEALQYRPRGHLTT